MAVDAFGPIGDSAVIDLTASSQAFALGALATNYPSIRLIALNASQRAYFFKFGTSGAVTVSRTDGMRIEPASPAAPVVIPVPAGSTHVALLAEGPSGPALISYGGRDFGDFEPSGDSQQLAITTTDQRVALSSIGATTPCIRLVSESQAVTALWIKLGDGTVAGDMTTSMKVAPGSVEAPTLIPVTNGETHLSIFCEGLGGPVVLSEGSILGFGGSTPPPPGSITNSQLADMPAWSLKARNDSASGEPQDVELGDLTAASPASTDFLFGFLSTGQMRVFEVDDLPAGSGITSIVTRVITASATYTPTAGLVGAIVRLQAAGGGSGSADGATAVAGYCSGGGGGGEYAEGYFSAATIGVSQSVTIGAAGTAGTNNGNNGGNASSSSFGALMTCNGGQGGTGTGSNGANGRVNAGGAGGTGGTGGDFRIAGGQGGTGLTVEIDGTGGFAGFPGAGGGSFLSRPQAYRAATFVGVTTTFPAVAGVNYGAGASGAGNASATSITGAAGGAAVCLITEFVS